MRITSHLLAALMLALGAAPASAAIKCWTNSEGVRECGNEVPPEYAQQETRILNQRGMTLEVQERAMSAEERAAQERRSEVQEGEALEEQRRREEQARSDRVLLSTFSSEQDIIMARDRQVSALRDVVTYTRLNVGKLEAKLAEYQKRSANYERSGKPIPANLEQDMATLQKQIENKRAYADTKEEELTALEQKYDRDLQRFRELMGARGK
ncbi:MAG: hypothetical protein AB7U81_15430 [Thiohalomonadaceae bacterium]